MFRRIRPCMSILALVLVFQLAMSGTAFAHYPKITAEAVCLDGSIVISYTATAWEGYPNDPPSRTNTRIDILVNGVLADSGAFLEPTFSFSGSVPAPAGAGPGDPVTVTAVAVDDWGNGSPAGQSESVIVHLPEEPCGQTGLGRFTGGGHQVRVDVARVTRGLTIHCDLLLSNNLEVNWQSDHFHMTEHLQTVACTDDPNIIQFPPAAPLDTLVGVGAGRYNNVAGFTIEFTLVDAGEPGRGVDQMAILIYETANPANVVLNVPLQVISGGNLQAHFDQPHQ